MYRKRLEITESIPMLCKNYIFDFEEVVADLQECYISAFSKAFSQFGIPFEEGKIKDYASTPLNEIFEKYYTGCTCKYRDFVSIFMGSFDADFNKAKLRPGIANLFEILEDWGFKIGIISECYEMYVDRLLVLYGLENKISAFVGMDRTAVARPNPYVLNLCMKELSANPSDTVVVATSVKNEKMCQQSDVTVLKSVSEVRKYLGL